MPEEPLQELLEELEQIQKQAYEIWAKLLNEVNGLHPATFELSIAIQKLRNTVDILETDIEPRDCVMFTSGNAWHAYDRPTHTTLCDTTIPLEDRVTPAKRVPNCPKCRELLQNTPKQTMNYVTVSPEAKQDLIENQGLSENDFKPIRTCSQCEADGTDGFFEIDGVWYCSDLCYIRANGG